MYILYHFRNDAGTFMLNILYLDVNGITEQLDELQLAAKFRSVAGVLASHYDSRDLHLDSITIRFHGAELLVDSRLELNCGRRYGLIGLNGCGK
jgi:ATP-binding cassette subfamily F protein 2